MTKIKISEEYEVIEDLKNGIFKATRHGEEWRNLVGDNLILSMLYKIEQQQEIAAKYEKALKEISIYEGDFYSHDMAMIAKQALGDKE